MPWKIPQSALWPGQVPEQAPAFAVPAPIYAPRAVVGGPVQLPNLPQWHLAPPSVLPTPAPWGGSWYGPTYVHGIHPDKSFRMVYAEGHWIWAARKRWRLLIVNPWGAWIRDWVWNGQAWVRPASPYFNSPHPPVNPPLIRAPTASQQYYGPMRWS